MANYYLVRHGTTAWVDQEKLHGSTDIPLNENGLKQAGKAAQALKDIKVSYLFSSPMMRAMQTAEQIGKVLNLETIPVGGLEELDFGWMEGRHIFDDVVDKSPSLACWVNHHWVELVRNLSGETKKQFAARVLPAWQDIVLRSNGEDFVFVGHSAVLDTILYAYFGKRFMNYKDYYSIHPCGISELKTNASGEVELVRLDDYDHVKEFFIDEH